MHLEIKAFFYNGDNLCLMMANYASQKCQVIGIKNVYNKYGLGIKIIFLGNY